ncbi:hypothetical protein JTB14_029533 [Gonioctena quinquepunctata]|nr:hypothetical protein JTB14_029533 [Gonioctena quinquepunctata]
MEVSDEWIGTIMLAGLPGQYGPMIMGLKSAATRRKLDPESKPCILIGYSLTSKAYRLFDVEKHAVFTSRDIIFSETEKGSTLLRKTGDTSRNAIFFPDSSETDEIFAENDSSDATGDFSPVDTESADSSIVTRYEGASENFLGFPDSAESEADDASAAVESDSDYILPETVDVQNENLRRGTRDKRPPIHLQDYDLNFVFTILSDDLVTVDDALSCPEEEEWQKAMDREYKTQLDNGTWEVIDLPPGISYVSKFNAYAGKIHWSAVKGIFRYLKGTANFQHEFSGQKDKVTNSLG